MTMDQLHDLTDCLEKTIGILCDFLEEVPPERLHFRAAEGFWTIYEHLNHLVLTQILLHKRIGLFMKNDHPRIVPYIPSDNDVRRETSERKPVDELLSRFAEWRLRQVKLLRTVTPEVLGRTATHPEYTPYSFATMVRHIHFHDGWHLYRMEELAFMRSEGLRPL